MTIPILKKSSTYTITDWYVAFAVSITIIWKPLATWVLHFDAAGRIPLFLLATAFIINIKRVWRTAFRFPLAIYCFVAVYMFINGYLQRGYLTYPADGLYLMFCAALEAPVIMLLTATEAKKDFDTTLDWLIIALYAYVILALTCSGIMTRVSLDTLKINANEIARYDASLFSVLLLKFFRRRLNFFSLSLAEIIPFFVIIQTQSRMALTMATMMIVTAIFLSQNFRNLKSIALYIIIIILFVVGMSYIMTQTQIGERMRGTTTQAEEAGRAVTSSVLDKFGDRGLQYFYSWPYFIEKPISGIGFKNWIIYNPLKHVCHSEYMVQYVENGLIAFIPYMIFFLSLTIRLWNSRKHKDRKLRDSSLFLFALMLSIAFSNSVLWSHDMYSVFATYALCFAHDKPEIKKRKRIRIVFKARPLLDKL